MQLLLVVLTLLAMAILLNAATGVPAAVHYIGHDAVSAMMAKGGRDCRRPRPEDLGQSTRGR